MASGRDAVKAHGWGESRLAFCDESNVQNLEAPFKALYRIIPHRGPPLMGHEPGVSKIGDGVGDEPEVEFLFVVDFQAAGHSRDVDVTDVIEVIAQRPGYVAIGDLSMVNVIQDFHAR